MPPRRHMRDTCEIGTLDAITSGPEPTDTWVYGSSIRCRFVHTTTREVLDGDEHALTDVQIHVPAGTTVSDSTRIKLTKRNHRVLATDEYYELVGEPRRTDDNRVIVCNAQSVPVGAQF